MAVGGGRGSGKEQRVGDGGDGIDVQRSEYQTDEQLQTTLVILLGCFLLLVIWLLIITLAVLCRRQRTKKEAIHEIKSPAEEEHFLEKEEKEEKEIKEEEEEVKYISEAPDVIQPVKLWYV